MIRHKVSELACLPCIEQKLLCGCIGCMDERREKLKTTLACNKCGGDLTSIEWQRDFDPYYGGSIVLSPGDDPRKKNRGTWYPHKEAVVEVSFRCWICGKLNWMSPANIHPSGYTAKRPTGSRCFTCHHCGAYAGLYFENWEKFIKEEGRGKAGIQEDRHPDQEAQETDRDT